jgi:RHS repeat-associated protein
VSGYGFTGERFDAFSGLLYLRARYYQPYNKMTAGQNMSGRFYDPQLGRFIQPDTIIPASGNPQAWNRYSYVFNNPLKYMDPTGHVPIVGITPEEPYRNPPYEPLTPPTPTPAVPPSPTAVPSLSEDEIALARMMWNEEREFGKLGMRVAGWVAINRLDVNFNDYDTLMGILLDPEGFDGYPGNDPLDPQYEEGERDLYYDALLYARDILNGTDVGDPTGGALFFANGASYREEMKAWAATHPNSGFWWMHIAGTNLYVSNQWYREEEE